MRGEHCIAGASVLTGISLILLVFAHIGQISAGAFVSNIYMVQLDVGAYGAGFVGATKNSAGGLYDTSTTDLMGTYKGLRQNYRYGFYKACGYQKSGAGICNSTTFGQPFMPLANMLSDTPQATLGTAADFYTQTDLIIPDEATSFRDNNWNSAMSRAGSVIIFIGSLGVLFSLITGVIKHRFAFFAASICSGFGALFLMIGAAIWTSIIVKDNWISNVKVTSGTSIGISVSAGPSLYLVWVAFAMTTLAVAPYVIACLTYRK